MNALPKHLKVKFDWALTKLNETLRDRPKDADGREALCLIASIALDRRWVQAVPALSEVSELKQFSHASARAANYELEKFELVCNELSREAVLIGWEYLEAVTGMTESYLRVMFSKSSGFFDRTLKDGKSWSIYRVGTFADPPEKTAFTRSLKTTLKWFPWALSKFPEAEALPSPPPPARGKRSSAALDGPGT